MRFDEPATLHTAVGPHALSLKTARGLWGRFRGLMLSGPLIARPTAQALLIPRCPSVHGFFMRYALDLVYLASSTEQPAGVLGAKASRYQVTHTAHLLPWRVSWGKKWLREGQPAGQALRSQHVLEMPAGSIESMNIAPGDWLELQP